jgi:light-regulated signal transduction histidine kinase (bacteriophytochrome)
VVNKSLEIVAWNKMCLKHYNLGKDMVIGRSINDVFEQGTGLNKLFIGIKAALKGEKYYIPAEESADSDRVVDRYFIPMFSEEGQVQTVLCVIHDLTNEFKIREELKHLNNSLEKKNLELEQKNEEIMTFAFAASHDLKEPIRKIRTFNNWLQQEEIEKLTPTGKKYLLATSRSAERLDSLLKDILILSRIQSEKEKKRILNVKEILQKVKEDMHDYIKERHTRIYSSAEGTVFANENQLIYLFRNLISNSIKFQTEGNKPVITINSVLEEGCTIQHKNAVHNCKYLHISFKDNGFGFEQKYEHKIFQIFQRLHRKEDYPGTGMGLTICKKIMEEHEGFITAESSLGQGAVFHLFFPV